VGVRKNKRVKGAEKAEQGVQTLSAITGMRKGSGVTAEKDSKAQPTNAGIPSRAPIVRALTPHENLTRPAIGDARKERRAAAAEEDTETRQAIVGVRKSKKVKIAEKAEEEIKETGNPPVNTEVPAKTPLVQAAMPHKSIALPDRNVGLGSDMHSG